MTPTSDAEPPRLVRLCLDLNVWCAWLISTRRGRKGGSSQALVRMVRQGECPAGAVQLVVSWGMLGRLREVCMRDLHVDPIDADTLVRGIAGLARYGPAGDAPYLVLGGTGVMPIRDEEDAQVLEVALAGRADVIATADISDFVDRRDKPIIEGEAFLHRKPDGSDLVIAHPDHVAAWLRGGIFPEADSLRMLGQNPRRRGRAPKR